MESGTLWPKLLPALTEEQERISNDFMRHWHEVLPAKYGVVDRFNHSYPVKKQRSFLRTIELGAGLGEHLAYETLTPEQRKEYYAVELRENMVERIRERCPGINVLRGDCQEQLPFPDGYFDRILAIHILEHLPNLPATVREMFRLCDKGSGSVFAVIPCEGGFAYSIARRISAQRVFEKRYKQSYKWLIEREHLNRPQEIICELKKMFHINSSSFFPLYVPSVTLNLCIGLTLSPRL